MRSDGPVFLKVAGRLASEVAGSAIWSHGRCNWVGALPRDESRKSGRAEVAALGPDLYGGTSGVALFLAEAGVRLRDDRLQAIARGAIRLALDHADRTSRQSRDGLYSGLVGIAYAAARVAHVLGAEDVHARARELLVDWRLDGARSPSADLMSGCAGAVIGLVALSPLVAETWPLDSAVELGDELIARADVTSAGWSWRDPTDRSKHNLCGYLHGAAGIGHALAELFGATGAVRFDEAATRAFDYERWWLDTRTGTWPDLRGVARGVGRDAPMPVSDSWCNGTFGIALSRLRAAELLASEPLRHEACMALAACEHHVAELLSSAPDDFSLCHGAAGAADVMLHATGRSGDLAALLARRGIELYAGPGATCFPCGTPLGDTPSLLLGASGIGMLYLRLSDPQLQSPLLIHRARLTARADTP
jgi:lantibiotic biosynthesis protein